MKLQRKLSNGDYIDCTPEQVGVLISRAVEFDQRYPDTFRGKLGLKSAADAITALAAGRELRTGSDWYDEIRDGNAFERRRQAAITRRNVDPNYSNEGWVLDCGHTVYHRSHIMSASRGSSCTDCYDRMSN